VTTDAPPAYLDSPLPIALAHRGGAADAPENSMAAFEHAVSLGYRYLETDVHSTADGKLLAFHDHNLDRVTDRRGLISRLSYAEVAPARIGGSEPIPLLEEVLTAWPEIRVNIDVKHSPAIRPLAEVIARTNAYDRICLTSFSDRRLARARAALGRPVCTASGPRTSARLVLAARRQRRRVEFELKGFNCVQVPVRLGRLEVVTPGLLTTCHELGLQVHVWTVNDRAEMVRMLDLGVDGIITDNIQALREILLARGQWPEKPAE
jgi:glycerophosphoryl diester phosphodiesterase